MSGTNHYTTKGLYNKYDKNHKEREKTDYYATPTVEVENILNTLSLDFSFKTILEPCVGGGHMLKGIYNYLKNTAVGNQTTIIATDLHEHELIEEFKAINTGELFDFLGDDYPVVDAVDWIIMNPPYATIEPFTIRALEIARKGVIMLGRIQFLEGSGRYENIFIENPPTDVYIYVDRIQCWKDGIEPTGSSAQGYAWYVWYKDVAVTSPRLHWIRRADK